MFLKEEKVQKGPPFWTFSTQTHTQRVNLYLELGRIVEFQIPTIPKSGLKLLVMVAIAVAIRLTLLR